MSTKLLSSMKLSNEVVSTYRNFDWASRDFYAQYLAQSYFYVNHSERFLALCIGLFKNKDDSLSKRFQKHLTEEKSHDLLLLNDLKKLGFSIDQFEELPSTRNLWETQYYKVIHIDPAALLGYIYFLEEFACKVVPEVNSELEGHFGRKCTTFLRLHAEEDPDHVKKALIAIEGLELHRQEEIVRNYKQSQHSFLTMIQEIIGVCNRKNQKKAA